MRFPRLRGVYQPAVGRRSVGADGHELLSAERRRLPPAPNAGVAFIVIGVARILVRIIRIFVGTDDGFMHSVRNTTSGGSESGVEDWAFMPREVMDKVSILRDNSPLTPHPYTVDGSPSAYIVDTDKDGTIGKDEFGAYDPTDKVILFFGLRRGGNSYYALDVTDPDSPSLVWSLSNSGDFAELGMSFSSPRVGTVKYGASPTPVIIFGGGYDPDKDSGSADDAAFSLHRRYG